MPTKYLLAGLPKKGEVAFVHYYHEAEVGSDVVVRAKGSPFKASIVAVNFEDDGILYTVRHITDNFTHVDHISDFVSMGDGSYPMAQNNLCSSE
jgi:hypothetical protein